MSDVQEVQAGLRRSGAGDFVEFGAISDGVFYPFGAVRSGDFDEAIAAGQQAQAPADAAPAAAPEAAPADAAPAAEPDPSQPAQES
jgi:hypothetical protein